MKKSLKVLFTLALVILFIGISSKYSNAQETWTVDDDGPADFSTIQAAIDAPATTAGDTIIVAEGTYYENLVINKSLTLMANSTVVINGDTTSDGIPDGSCIMISANGVTIDGFEIKNGYNGIIGETSDSVISNNKIKEHLNYVGSNGVGILLWGNNDNNQILYNKIEKNDRQGIFIGFGDASKISSGNLIAGNDIKKNGLYTQPNGPDASAYGIQLWNADGNTIENNKISEHDDWFPYPVLYPDYDFAQGIYLIASFGNIVQGNDLCKNNYGVCLWSYGRTIGDSNQINHNNIHDNTGYGVRNVDVPHDATYNWWGDATGPGPVGLGDTVSANVNYSPWLHYNPHIQINIKPFSRRNIIILSKWGLISVAILSADNFNAPNDVDRTSLTFGRTGYDDSLAFCSRWAWDVNRDHRRDLICYFWTKKTGFRVGDTEGILKGNTNDGVHIWGSDSVKIVKPWRWWWSWW